MAAPHLPHLRLAHQLDVREHSELLIPFRQAISLVRRTVFFYNCQILIDLCESSLQVLWKDVEVLQVLLGVVVFHHPQALLCNELQVRLFVFAVCSRSEQLLDLGVSHPLGLLCDHMCFSLCVVLVAGLPELKIEQNFL